MKSEAVAGVSFVVACFTAALAVMSFMAMRIEIRNLEANAVRHGYATHAINEYGDIKFKWRIEHPLGEHE